MVETAGLFFYILIVFVAVIFGIVRWGLARTPRPKRKTIGDNELEKRVEKQLLSSNDFPNSDNSVRDSIGESVKINPLIVADGRNLGKRNRLVPMHLTYLNTREEITNRLIEPVRSGANVDYFDAYCHLEELKRSFRFDRVIRATDAATGEIVSQADVYRRIHPTRRVPDWLSETG